MLVVGLRVLLDEEIMRRGNGKDLKGDMAHSNIPEEQKQLIFFLGVSSGFNFSVENGTPFP